MGGREGGKEGRGGGGVRATDCPSVWDGEEKETDEWTDRQMEGGRDE